MEVPLFEIVPMLLKSALRFRSPLLSMEPELLELAPFIVISSSLSIKELAVLVRVPVALTTMLAVPQELCKVVIQKL